ncbi:MAG: hypothetical protein QM831_43790 [Kofleriaceae bacterium]
MAVPPSITVTDHGDADFTITRHWRGARKVFGLNQAVFMLLFTALASALVSSALIMTDKVGAGWPVFVGVALMLYVALANVVNTTTIVIRDGMLAIDHGPLPWLSSRHVPVEQLASIDSNVRAKLRDGRTITLLAYPRWAALAPDESRALGEELSGRLFSATR